MELSALTLSNDIPRLSNNGLSMGNSTESPSSKVLSPSEAIQKQAKSLLQEQQTQNSRVTISDNAAMADANNTQQKNDAVRVSSTIGKAASSGQLSREEALAIYQKIASLL